MEFIIGGFLFIIAIGVSSLRDVLIEILKTNRQILEYLKFLNGDTNQKLNR